MIQVLGNRTYRHLLAAQVIALIGTGLATVALGLLAYDIAGKQAGAVLGTALAIKMIAYIGVAPIAGAFADRAPRKSFLVAMDLVRAAVALCLPFVTEVWQVYALIFALQSASAAFTPTFQATIPDVLPEERDYTRALSLSRLAYDMESLTSPALAAALLTIMSFHWLFSGTAIGFIASALLVVTSALPEGCAQARQRRDLRQDHAGNANLYSDTAPPRTARGHACRCGRERHGDRQHGRDRPQPRPFAERCGVGPRRIWRRIDDRCIRPTQTA